MAEVTWLELKTRVARRLQLIAETESLPANYGDTIADALLSVQGQLNALGVASFDVENGIDHAYVDPLVDMAAAELADEFGLPEPRRTIVKSQALGMPGRSMAERRMRALFPARKIQTEHDMTVV